MSLSKPLAKKRIYSNSVGNKHLLSAQKRQCNGQALQVSSAPPKYVSEEDVAQDIFQLQNCCAYGGRFGCIKRNFMTIGDKSGVNIDLNGAIELVMQCRQKIIRKNEEKKNAFIADLFRECISGVISLSDGKEKFSMKYEVDGHRLCKKGYACAYGISVHALERASDNFKIVEFGKVNQQKIRKWADATIPPYTYDTMEAILLMNTSAACVGEFTILLVMY